MAAFVGTIWMAAVFALVAAIASALGKVALDSSIQTDIPDAARSSAFGRSETALQLAWVFGGALGVLLPPDFTIGFSVVAVVGALMFTQSLLTARGSTLVPGLGGNRPRFPGEDSGPVSSHNTTASNTTTSPDDSLRRPDEATTSPDDSPRRPDNATTSHDDSPRRPDDGPHYPGDDEMGRMAP